MKTINIHDAKEKLHKLIQQAQQGEEIVITNYGEPLVRLEPYHKKNDDEEEMWTQKKRLSTQIDQLPAQITSTYVDEKE